MTNVNSFIQRLSSRQCTEQSTRKGVSSTVRIGDLFVLESVNTVRLDVIKPAGADSDGWLSTMRNHHNTIPGGVGFWLFGESLGDGGEIFGVGKTVRAGPSLCFGLVTDKIINIGEDFLELGTEELRDEGSGEVEDKNLGK